MGWGGLRARLGWGERRGSVTSVCMYVHIAYLQVQVQAGFGDFVSRLGMGMKLWLCLVRVVSSLQKAHFSKYE